MHLPYFREFYNIQSHHTIYWRRASSTIKINKTNLDYTPIFYFISQATLNTLKPAPDTQELSLKYRSL